MKKSGILMAAASVTAISASSSSSSSTSSSKVRISRNKDDNMKKKDGNCSRTVATSPSSDKFAPKFDGLRFIETLVTAHR